MYMYCCNNFCNCCCNIFSDYFAVYALHYTMHCYVMRGDNMDGERETQAYQTRAESDRAVWLAGTLATR